MAEQDSTSHTNRYQHIQNTHKPLLDSPYREAKNLTGLAVRRSDRLLKALMLRSSSVYRALVFVPAFFLAIAAGAKSPSTRDSADPVVVDVVVTDANSQPVKGLTEQDFRVFENNKKERIRSFEVHDQQSEAATAASPDPSANTFTNAGPSAPASFNVILLDQLNTSIQDQALAVHKLNDFLAHKPTDAAYAIFSLRNDEVACKPYRQDLWTYGSTAVELPDWDSGCASMGRLLLVQGFTTDKARLMAAIQGNDSAQPHATWLRVGLSNLGGIGGCGFLPGNGGLDYYNRGPAQVIDTTMPSLAELSNFLRPLPGRKSLIWMSDNFDAAPIPQPSDMWFPPKFKAWDQTDVFSQIQMTHLTASRIAEARVAIYPVDLTGKSKGIDVKRIPGDLLADCFSPTSISYPWCHLANFGFAGFPILPSNNFGMGAFPILPKMSSVNACDEHGPKLDTVASQTGGQAFHKADNIQPALAAAATDAANYYTIRYVPTTKFDGKRREIKVVLAGKGYHLKYHETYFADDPAAVSRPDGNAVADVYLPNPTGPMPWIPLRIAPEGSASNESQNPIAAAMGYAMPETQGIVFSAHIEPTQKPVQATPAQMAQLQDYESFKAERISKAMENLTKEDKKKTQHKGRTVLPPLESLPAPDPVFLQPYSIDYSIPVAQLAFKKDATDNNTIKLEVAVLAYDALGKKVTGLQQVLEVSLSANELQQLQTSGYHLSENLDVPDRVTVLRLAVRDVSGEKIGSLEIPLWAVQSPYRRKQLRLPMNLSETAAPQERGIADATH